MSRKIILAFSLLSLMIVAHGQLQSPDTFLGYKVGSRYTPHFKIVNYFQHVADQAGTMVKLQQYGETNEGRPLLLAFISSPENIKGLEAIRLNNLRLANLSMDKMAASENAPAIVWLSYNVHGNETSSSEAAMKTLYALADPANRQTKEWLKNTVVIIDPCINPDGRDRYVNWFNSIVGKNANPQLMSREHREPWPGGRTNHYNFDLNRDWVWQTQIESQQRLAVYSEWLPQIHVDYHEQGINAPYYFAPAAQPFHEVITPWQREFQTTIGKNHAKYFDAKGWLYFTREIFDLYYPSYGDTYPLYNGAIGMTYEQGGGGAGALAAINDEGDTLTLNDRVMHHYTTGLSTIEIASQNATKLIREFRKFYQQAVTDGAGIYKTYIIKNEAGHQQRIQALLKLLDKNHIAYSSASGSAKGYNYQTGKEESFNMSNDIIVSSIQPHAAMVKVLFEPQGKLVDSVTYDITAWSLPYAYGLNAYASKDKISGTALAPFPKVVNAKTTYGYVIRWEGVNTAKLAAQLLKKGILLRYTEEPFEIEGQQFASGSLLVLRTANQSFGNDLWDAVRTVADENNIRLFPVSTGFVDKGFDFGSDKVHPLKAPKVVLLTGEGVNSNAVGEIWHFFEQELEYPVTLVNANDISRANWNDIDVLIMPDGYYRLFSDKGSLESFREWINKGGRVIALESAIAQFAKADFGIKSKKEDEQKDSNSNYSDLKKFSERERDAIKGFTPGSILKVELDNTHPLAFGYPDYYYTLKIDDQVYEFIKEDGWNVGVIRRNNQVAGFIGIDKKEKLKDGLLLGVQDVGRGTVTYFADNPLFRDFWENGKLLFCNAVFFVGQ